MADTKPDTLDDPEEYRQDMLRCYLAAEFIVNLPLEKLASAQSHAESVAPFMDPTAWIRNIGKMREDMSIVAALQKAFRALPQEFVDMVRLRMAAKESSQC